MSINIIEIREYAHNITLLYNDEKMMTSLYGAFMKKKGDE